ncbi:MAG: glycosyltransferase family 2 protein [Actinomycetota bacterium]|nr:glycosyltransferase family 2 protein [Actinomycetota bacterium]
MSVVALIPAFNEADLIGATVIAARSIRGVDRVLVVDDGSTDSTAEVARAAGAEVLALPDNVGKGAALDTGIAHLAEEIEVLLLLDGDLGQSAEQGQLLLDPVSEGRADLVIAAFPRPAGKAGVGLVKGLARWGIARMGGGFVAQAPLSGQRALSARCLANVTPFAFGYGVEVALTVRALRAGMRVIEIPTTMSHAATGRDLTGFAHRGQQFVHVGRALARLAFERRRTPA